MENQWLVTALIAVSVGLIAFFSGREVHRRRTHEATQNAEKLLSEARVEAQRTLARAEEDARALAESYREREVESLEHRRLEVSSLEDRLEQRESTLEQRAANLAQREERILLKEEEVVGAQREAEAMREDLGNAFAGTA